jgi:hydroxymethylpyrimidine pyrophosphatase-like HAD family hydrolase
MQNFLNPNSKVIAIDFDGTIVEHKFPKIGKEMRFAFMTLKALQQKGHKLILWTIRTGNQLEDAVNYCKENGIEFYAINNNFNEEARDENISRKINQALLDQDSDLATEKYRLYEKSLGIKNDN